MGRKKKDAPAPVPKPAPRGKCPITRAHFAAEARPIVATLRGANVLTADGTPGELEILVSPLTFKSGTLGWFANVQRHLLLDGAVVTLQMQLSIQVCGSKLLPGWPVADAATPTEADRANNPPAE
jgi:hypothetical protein